MLPRRLSILVVLVALVCVSCGKESHVTSDLSSYVDIAKESESVTVKRGAAREESGPVRLYGFDFEEGTLTISTETAEELSKWFADPDSFRNWRGEKKCGGFHPDYAIEWKKGGKSVVVLLCLGCHEIIAHKGRSSVRLDVNPKAYDHVESLLAPDRAKRRKAMSDGN